MDGAVGKLLGLGVTLFFLAGAFIYGLVAYNQGADASKESNQETSSTLAAMKENKYEMYDNMEMKGSQVVNTVKKFREDGEGGKIGVKIVTNTNKSGKWYYNSFDAKALNPVTTNISELYDASGSNVAYVNPNGTFKGSIDRDANNTIRAIIFTQK